MCGPCGLGAALKAICCPFGENAGLIASPGAGRCFGLPPDAGTVNSPPSKVAKAIRPRDDQAMPPGAIGPLASRR